jgi:hypothetical protein
MAAKRRRTNRYGVDAQGYSLNPRAVAARRLRSTQRTRIEVPNTAAPAVGGPVGDITPDDVAQPTAPAVAAIDIHAVDAAPPEHQSMGQRFLQWAQQPRAADKPKGSASTSDEVVTPQLLSDALMVPILGVCFLAVPRQYRMSDAERQAASMPICRILMRHFSVLQYVTPDLIDAAAILGVLVAWVRRVEREQDERKRAAAAGADNPASKIVDHPAMHRQPTEVQRSDNGIPSGSFPADLIAHDGGVGAPVGADTLSEYLGRAGG